MKKADWLSRLQRVEERAVSFQRAPLSSRYRPRLSRPAQPASVWRLFPRQSLAISFSHSCREDVHVFALEKEEASLGQRIYLVTSYSELWHYYSTYRQSLMHCYEVIPEGAVCKLYFDLEFHKPTNHGRDGPGMVASLIQVVCEQLEEVLGVVCSSREVLNLDSSTGDKFSRHLIFLLPNAAFKDNTHVGRFLRAVLQPVLTTLRRRGGGEGTSLLEEEPALEDPPQEKKKRQGETDLSFLLVKNKEGEDCLFVDLGVYTRNRNFRLYRSSKAGRNAAFTIAPDNHFSLAPNNHFTTTPQRNAEQDLFLCSLISNVSFTGQRILTWDEPESDLRHTRTHTTTDSLEGYQCSPHREVDDFVVTLLRKDGIQGNIRRWSYFVSQQLLVYDIMGYRWCDNVGRAHKSNNIMIIVDLREEVWYQKCHDPACKTFRSSSLPLPQELCVSYIIAMDEEDQTYLMDESGNLELSHREPEEQGGSAAAQPRDTASSWGREADTAGLGPPGRQGGSDTGQTQGGEEAGWGEDCPDDLLYLDALEDVESTTHLPDSNTHPTDSNTHNTHPTDNTHNTHPTDSTANTHTTEDVSDQLLLQIMDEFEGRGEKWDPWDDPNPDSYLD